MTRAGERLIKAAESATSDMVEGYLDGSKDDRTDYPESLANRGAAYRHGWLNGRDDRLNKPRAPAAVLRIEADEAERKDAA